MRGNSPTAVVIFVFLFLGLFGNPPAWADLNPGDTLGQANWQEAKGRLPDLVLRRFQDGSYQAKVIALPASLSWGSKFKAASAANAGKSSVDANGSLIDPTTHTYPAFLYGYPFPQIDSKDPQAAAKVVYNFSYTLMQPDDADRFSNLHRVTPSALDHYIEFQGQILFYGSRFSGPIANPDATLRKLIIAGVAPYEVVGVVTLEWVYLDPGQWNSLWTFIPALKRVRRLNAANGSDSLFGLDLAHDDPYLFSGKVQYFTWKLVGVQEALVPYTLPNPKLLRPAKRGYLLENPTDLLIALSKGPCGWSRPRPKIHCTPTAARCCGSIENCTWGTTKKLTTKTGGSGACCSTRFRLGKRPKEISPSPSRTLPCRWTSNGITPR